MHLRTSPRHVHNTLWKHFYFFAECVASHVILSSRCANKGGSDADDSILQGTTHLTTTVGRSGGRPRVAGQPSWSPSGLVGFQPKRDSGLTPQNRRTSTRQNTPTAKTLARAQLSMSMSRREKTRIDSHP